MANSFDRCQAPPGFAELVGSKAELRGPRGKEHVRVHKSWRKPAAVMVRHSGKFHLVDQDLHATLGGRAFAAEVRCAFSSKTGLFFWPVPVGDDVLQKAAEAAVKSWMSIVWINDKKEYNVEKSAEKLPDPDWSVATIDAAFEAAIGGRILSKAEDDVVQAILKKKLKAKPKAKATEKPKLKEQAAEKPKEEEKDDEEEEQEAE
jgi:hypothetical protein